MMNRVLLLSALALIAVAPVSDASCHWCGDAVVESCTAGDLAACNDNAQYMGGHFAQHVGESVQEKLGD